MSAGLSGTHFLLQFVELDSIDKLSRRIRRTKPHRHSAQFTKSHSSGKPNPQNSQRADPQFAESHSPGEAIQPFRELHRIGFPNKPSPPNSRGVDPPFAECNSSDEAIQPFRELHRIGFIRQAQPAEFAGSRPTRSSTLRLIHPFPIQTLRLYEGQMPCRLQKPIHTQIAPPKQLKKQKST